MRFLAFSGYGGGLLRALDVTRVTSLVDIRFPSSERCHLQCLVLYLVRRLSTILGSEAILFIACDRRSLQPGLKI
jgi:hypothetical protein